MKKTRPGLNLIASALLTVAVVIIAAILGDFYFDLNDDVLMKDILSGAYTGVPAGHNIQMLYPISALIALFYRLVRGLDWYGIFLCGCQFLCLFILAFKMLQSSKSKAFAVVTQVFMFMFALGTILSHFVFVQYTFTCGFLSMTAAFLIVSGAEKRRADNILALVLIILAYLIRSEMLLLTLPIVGVGIFIKWWLERMELTGGSSGGIPTSANADRKKNFRIYAALCIAILLGIIISTVIHKASYSSTEWKEFNALFDARTELYDFQFIPDYEENREFYDSIGISAPEQELLVNYNFGIDEEIDTQVLNSVAEYASKLKTDETPLLQGLIQSITPYLYRLRHVTLQKSYEYPMTDAPYNVIVGLLYLGVAAIYLISGKKGTRLPVLFMLVLLFACRSSLWLYIIVRGRDPIRITHPLYLVEMAVLLGMLAKAELDNKRYAMIPLALAAIASALFIPNQVDVIRNEMAERDMMRSHYNALYLYFENHSENFYFVDVYTSVSATEGEEKTFSEKMFENVNNNLANHDLMGGWASKSPLFEEKMAAYGFTSMQDAILLDNVYVVNKGTQDIDWLSDYYLDKGIKTEIRAVEMVTDAFVIYKVEKIN